MNTFFLMFRDTLSDMLGSAGAKKGFLRALFLPIACVPALIFTLRMRRFNRNIQLGGTGFAARKMLPFFYKGLSVTGTPPASNSGGLVVCNHPGIGDSLALLAVLPEGKFKMVARERDFFRAMPEVWKRLIIVPEDPSQRHRTVGEILNAILKGDIVVLYPAGVIEPDPVFRDWGWLDREEPLLKEWSPIISLIVRLLKRSPNPPPVYPVLAKNVISQKALFSWWASRGKTRKDQEEKAVGYQILRNLARDQNVELIFGEPLSVLELNADQPGIEGMVKYIQEKVTVLNLNSLVNP